MRILLIEPSDQWITNNKQLKHNDQVMVPLGLMYLSAYIKKHFEGELEIKVISTIIDFDDPSDLKKVMDAFKPDIIGIKCVIFYNNVIQDIINFIRSLDSEALLVAGGPNVSPSAENLFENNLFDLYVQGEGEETFLEIVQMYHDSGKQYVIDHKADIAGLILKKEQKIITTKARPLIDDIDTLPIPDYDVIDFDKYSNFLNYGYTRRKMAALFTSRGCPYQCTYCHVVFGKKFRYRTVENLVHEIHYLYENHGVKDFAIVDDIFNLDKNRLVEFNDYMINYGPKVNLYFPNGLRADILTPQLIDDMVKAGTIWITYSLESSSKRIQKVIKKYVNVDKLKEVVDYSCEKNIITNCCLMVGFPTETISEAEKSLEFFADFKHLTLPYYFSVKYFQDTSLFNSAGDFGINLEADKLTGAYHNYSFQDTPDIKTKDFEKLNYWYLRNIFMNKERIENSINILDHHFTQDEINDMYSVFFRKKVNNIDKDIMPFLNV
ncbi:MAG: radical SAM protein [Crocinitomix sp.]|nr:radical SAM protein [Crocinitomix sp.]